MRHVAMVDALGSGEAMVEGLTRNDPRLVGPFRLFARLGRGGFGTVYAGWCPDRPDGLAAVKVMHPNLAEYSEIRARFAREIEAIKLVESRFVPRFIADYADRDIIWMATELLPGPSLDKVVDWRGPLPEDAVWHLGAGIVAGLMAIHGANLIHRDLKPHNVVLLRDAPRVIDFSLVYITYLPHNSSSLQQLATLKYAPPEQLAKGVKEAREPADVYALGATLLFAATGHPPYDDMAEDQTGEQPTPAGPDLGGLPAALHPLVEGCLQRAPERRPRLADLRAEFARRVGAADSSWDSEAFTRTLPLDLLDVLGDFRRELMARADHMDMPEAARRLRRSNRARRGATDDGVSPLPRFNPRDEVPDEPRVSRFPEPRVPYDRLPAAAAAGRRPGGLAVTTPDPAAARRAAPALTRAGVPVPWHEPFASWIQAPVAVLGDTAVVTCADGTVSVRRASDGVVPVSWLEPVRLRPVPGTPALIAPKGSRHGTAYVGFADGYLQAVDLATRQVSQVAWDPSGFEGNLVMAHGRVHAMSAAGTLYSVDPYTGTPQVLHRLPGATGVLAVADGTIVAADLDGRVHAIDAGTGQEKWEMPVPTGGHVLSPPLATENWLYVCGTDGVLREVALTNGRVNAVCRIGAPVHVAPACDGRQLYIGSSDGTLRAYDISHRPNNEPLTFRWERTVGGEIAGLAAADDGVIYVAAGGRLLRLDAKGNSRELLNTEAPAGESPELRELGGVIGAAPVAVAGRCYVVGLSGWVACLRPNWS